MGSMQDQFWGDRCRNVDRPAWVSLDDRDPQGRSHEAGTGAAADGVDEALLAAARLTPSRLTSRPGPSTFADFGWRRRSLLAEAVRTRLILYSCAPPTDGAELHRRDRPGIHLREAVHRLLVALDRAEQLLHLAAAAAPASRAGR